MATALEIVLLDGSDGGDSSSEVAPGASAIGVSGAPAVSQSQPAIERDPSSPQREDFRDLRSAISDLAKRISGTVRDGEVATRQPVATDTPTPSSVPASSREDKRRVDETPQRTDERVARQDQDSGRDREQPKTAAPQSFDAAADRILGGLRESIGGTTKPPPEPGPVSRAVTAIKESRVGQAVSSGLDTRTVRRISQVAAPVGAGVRRVVSAAGSGAVRAGSAIGRGARAVGSAGASVAGTGAKVAGASAIGAIVAPVAAVTVALGAMAFATKKVSGMFSGFADELEGVSGPVAAARARNEARRQVRLAERGQRSGAQVAQVVGAQGRFAEAIDDLKEELAKLAPLAEAGVDTATAGVRILLALKENIDVALVPLIGGDVRRETAEARRANLEALNAIQDILRENEIDDAGAIDPDILRLLNLPPARPVVPPNGDQ